LCHGRGIGSPNPLTRAHIDDFRENENG